MNIEFQRKLHRVHVKLSRDLKNVSLHSCVKSKLVKNLLGSSYLQNIANYQYNEILSLLFFHSYLQV